MEPLALDSVIGGAELEVLNEEDEEENLGSQPPASTASSQRRLRDDREAREAESREREFAHPIDVQPVTIAPERPSIFSRLFWAPFGQRAPASHPADIANQDPLHGLAQPNEDIIPPRPLFISGQSSLASMLGLLLTTMALLALLLFAFETCCGPIMNPLLFNPINHTSIIPTGTVQQLLHATSHDYDRLNRRIGLLEQQWKRLPLHVDPLPEDQINWFTIGWGASVDEFLSSPRAAFCPDTWKPWPLNFVWKESCPEDVLSPPPIAALLPWDDAARDRWCAPRSPFGKLQLAVQFRRWLRPTALVVENVARDAAPVGYMKTAPREVELWIQVVDKKIRENIGAAINQLYPRLWADSSPQGRELSAAQTLGHDFVPVGRWTYNIYESQNIQTFKIPIPLEEYGVQTSKVAIRVNSNWGNTAFTCINRFRLHADDTTGIEEYLEEDPAANWKH